MIHPGHLQKGAALFLKLLNEQVISMGEALAQAYYDEDDVRIVTNTMADEAGMKIFYTRENMHMISLESGSVFATSYTQMKQKYEKLDKKVHFHLANLIICVFLAEVDKESHLRVRWEEEGVSYASMELRVSETLSQWQTRQVQGESFSDNWQIALDDISEIWDQFSPYSKDEASGSIRYQRGQTRYGFIHAALRPLADQKLIIQNTKDNRILPTVYLYERLDEVYHSRDRMKKIQTFIMETRRSEEGENA